MDELHLSLQDSVALGESHFALEHCYGRLIVKAVGRLLSFVVRSWGHSDSAFEADVGHWTVVELEVAGRHCLLL